MPGHDDDSRKPACEILLAMSAETVRIVRQAFDAAGRGDLDGVLRVCDENIVITQPSELPDASSSRQHGHAGVREAFAIWPEQWDDYRVENIRVLADPGDLVVVAVETRGRGRRSGVEVAMEFAFVFTVRDDKVVEWRSFTDEGRALEAAGLTN
jgi:ketosteroid isomerase-like protein